MKIIDNQKDYYDYLVGQFGCDERLMYDRREGKRLKYISNNQKVRIYVGEYMYEAMYVKKLNKFVYGDELIQYLKPIPRFYRTYTPLDSIFKYNISESELYYLSDSNLKISPFLYFNNTFISRPVYVGLEGKNYKNDKPIEIHTGLDYNTDYIYLEDFNFHEILSPEQAWISIEGFIGTLNSKKEKQVPVGDDKVRIVSAGFDLKASFRNIKK